LTKGKPGRENKPKKLHFSMASAEAMRMSEFDC
jgi:hypothetical protein